MGAVNFSLDLQLVTGLKKVLPLPVFFETGTFKGDTIKEMLPYFGRLITAELSEPLWKEAINRFVSEKKVEPYLGNSPDVIAKFHSALKDSSVLYWLDAHWCVADDTSGEKSQCPLLEEIHSIGQLNDQSVILIDDARLFLAPPPLPHETSQWPSIDSIITALKQTSSRHELSVVNDVIIFYPKLVRDSVISYAKKQGVDWLRASQSLLENVELRRVLEEKEAEIQQKEAGIQQKEAEIQKKEAEIQKKEIEIQQKEVALIRLTKSLEEKEDVIQDLQFWLDKLRANQSDDENEILKNALEEKEAQMQRKHETLMQLIQSLEEKEEVIQEISSALDAYRSAWLAQKGEGQ